MADWEDRLPPRARERLARVGDMSGEERQRMKDSQKLDSLLADFYRGEMDAEALWARFKEYSEQGKGELLREVQLKLIDSLGLGSSTVDIQKRKEAILAVESLKQEPNVAALEGGLNSVVDLQRNYGEQLQQAYDELKAQVERDPRQRMEQVRQGQDVGLVQLTVEEAVRRNPRWKDFVAEHERRYNDEFARLIERLKREAR